MAPPNARAHLASVLLGAVPGLIVSVGAVLGLIVSVGAVLGHLWPVGAVPGLLVPACRWGRAGTAGVAHGDPLPAQPRAGTLLCPAGASLPQQRPQGHPEVEAGGMGAERGFAEATPDEATRGCF